jgi:hypothetical protein
MDVPEGGSFSVRQTCAPEHATLLKRERPMLLGVAQTILVSREGGLNERLGTSLGSHGVTQKQTLHTVLTSRLLGTVQSREI